MFEKLIINEKSSIDNFLYVEILKRHLEEYNKDLICDIEKFMKFDRNNKNIHWEFEVSRLYCTLQSYRIYKSNKIKNEDHDKNFNFFYLLNKAFFDRVTYKDMLDKSLEIVDKYKVTPLELLFIRDIGDFIDNYIEYINDDNERAYLFESHLINFNQEYETSSRYSFTDSKKFIINKKELTDEELSLLKLESIAYKIHSGEKIEKYEDMMIKHYMSKYSIIKKNKKSAKAYIFGLYGWDLLKRFGNCEDAYLKYAKLQKKLNKCKDLSCPLYGSHSQFDNCKKYESCIKYVNDAINVVSNSIKINKILPLDSKGNRINPSLDEGIIRYPYKFFDTAFRCFTIFLRMNRHLLDIDLGNDLNSSNCIEKFDEYITEAFKRTMAEGEMCGKIHGHNSCNHNKSKQSKIK